MEEDHRITDEAQNPDRGSSQNRYPPPPPLPPVNPLGRLSHVPFIEPNHFPKAPIPFTFGTDLSSDTTGFSDTLRSSSSFNEYLQQHHPTYSASTDLDQTYDLGRSASALRQTSPQSLSQFSTRFPPQSKLIPPSSEASSTLEFSSIFAPSISSLHPVPFLPTSSNSSQNQVSPDPLHFHWHSASETARLPLSPQDVEYLEGVVHSSPVPDTAPQQPYLRATEFRTVSSRQGSILGEDAQIEEIENDDIESAIDPTLRWLQTSGKRRYEESSLVEEDVSNQMQSFKKPRKITSQAKQDGGPPVRTDQTEDEAVASKPRKEPRGRGRPKGQKAGPRPTLDPGPEFMSLYNQAIDAFIEDNDVLTAQTKVLQAIGVNPEIFAAHSLLADIHFAKNDHEKGLDALIGGLHAHMNDVELWREVGDVILTDNHEVPQKRLERAMYCFGAILRKDPKDMDARFQRAECARLLGHVTRAFSDLNILLQDDPHNSTVLAQITKLCADVDDAPKAKLLYQEHFEYYKNIGISEDDSFTWQDVGVYVDLLAQTGETAQAIVMLKRLSRWLSGRQTEDFWEEFTEDDREFDQNHYPRRLEVDDFEPNTYPEQDYGEALPLDMRAKLGILRLKLNYREEAQSHFDWLAADLDTGDSMVDEYSDTFLEIAKALHDVKEHREALRFYGALEEAELELGFEFWIGLGTSAYICELRDRAIKAYEQALLVNPQSIEARTQLAKLYRDLGDRPNALKYGREAVVMSQDAIPQTGNRKYENKENRLLREAAEKALKGAYRLPRKPHGALGKVPDSLKYRTRFKSKFTKYVPRETEEPHSASGDEFGRPTKTRKERPKKMGPPKKKGRPAKAAKESSAVPDANNGNSQASIVEENAPDGAERVSTDKRSSAKRTTRPYRKPPSKVDPQKHYEDLQTLYQTLLKHQPAMRNGDSEATRHWIDCAQAMVDDFRTIKAFFPAERHKRFDGYPAAVLAQQPSSSVTVSADHSPAPDQPTHQGSTDMPPPAGKSKSATPQRIADKDIPDQYCDILFTSWLDIFLELALVTANSATSRYSGRDLQTDCYSVINAALDCNVFYHHPQALTQIYSVYLSCCLALNDDVTLYNTVLRWFMNEYAFCTDTYRLYSAVALVGEYMNVEGKSRIEGSMYRDSSNQKYLFRQLCSIDQQLPKQYGVGTDFGPVPSFMRRERDGLRKQRGNEQDVQLTGNTPAPSAVSYRADQSLPPSTDMNSSSQKNTGPAGSVPRRDRLGNPIGLKTFSPKEMDVVLFILYSHIMMANNSFTNALNYLYRAYSLDPSNTVCLLSMAFCYLTELFKRQASNRHALSLMGWVWFGRYEVERRKWAETVDEQNATSEERDENGDSGDVKPKMIDLVNREIEFNKARCWEMLGMADLAVRGYKRMLALPNTKTEKLAKNLTEDGEDDIAEEPESFDMEAAYALSTIYMINGNGEKARAIAEKYMVVE